MSMPASVILRRRPLDEATLQAHVRTLADRLGADPYTTRVALRGEGLAQVARTDDEGLIAKSLSTLRELGYDAARVDALPKRTVLEMKSFETSGAGIRFHHRRGEVWMPKGARAIGVLASLKGDALQRILRKASYTGDPAGLSPEEKLDSIMTSGPILDLYLPSDDGRGPAVGPLRIEPGRFNPDSLGERAGVSARQNLETVIDLVRACAGRLDIEMDFGFFQLPKCRFDPAENDPEAHERNLTGLVNYGSYLVELYRQAGPPAAARADVRSSLTGALDAATGRIAESSPALAHALGMTTAALAFTEKQKAETLIYPEAPGAPAFLPPPPADLRQWSGWYRRTHAIFAVLFAVMWSFSLISANTLEKGFALLIRLWGVDRGLLFFAAAGLAFYECFRFVRVKRWMDHTPTSKARSVAMGMVEMKGVARRAYNLHTPLTGVPCVWYRLREYERRRDSEGKERWTQVGDTSSGPVPFYLDDETGRVLIDPLGAKMKPTHRQELDGRARTPWGPASDPALDIAQDTRYVEEMIAEGSAAYVMGQAVAMEPMVVPMRERIARKLRRVKEEPARMARYDVDGDGRIDEYEWNAARNEMEKEAYADAAHEETGTAEDGVTIAVRRPDMAAFPFVISNKGEENLMARYTWIALGFLILAMTAAGLGAALLTDWIGAGKI